METPKEVVTEKKSIDSKDDLDDLDEFLDLDDNFNYGDVVWEEVPDDDVLLDDVEEVESLEKEQKHVSNEKTAKDVTTDEEPKDANVDDFIEELTEQKDVSEVEKIIKPKETKSNIIEEDLESDSISSIKSSIADKFKIDDDSENTDLTKIISYEDKDEDLSIKSVKETQDDKKSDDDSDSIL